jgi:hypothetical protein
VKKNLESIPSVFYNYGALILTQCYVNFSFDIDWSFKKMVATRRVTPSHPIDASASSSLILLSLNHHSTGIKTSDTARVLIYRFMTTLSVHAKNHPSLLITLDKLAQTFDAHANDLDHHLIHTVTYLKNCAQTIKEHENTLIAPYTMHEKWQHTMHHISHWCHALWLQLQTWITGKPHARSHYPHRKQSSIEKAIGNIYLQIDNLLNDETFIDAMNDEIKAHQQTKQHQNNNDQQSTDETLVQKPSLTMHHVFRKTTLVLQAQTKPSPTSYLSSLNTAFFRSTDTPDSIAFDENESNFYPIDPVDSLRQSPNM